jgi:isoamylase
VPMLLAGDERGHTQHGNNNAYCQDNETTWLEWSPDEEREALTTFVRRVIALRRTHPSFRRRGFFTGRPPPGSTVNDVCWLRPDGGEMTPDDWNDSEARALGMLVSGLGITDSGPRGEVVRDDDFLLLFSAHHDDLDFVLPTKGEPWYLLLDTATGVLPPEEGHAGASANLSHPWAEPRYRLPSRSFVLMTRTARQSAEPSAEAST